MKTLALTILGRLRRLPVVFVLAVVAALAVLFFSETTYRDSTAAMQRLVENSTVRFRMQRLLRLMVDAETAQRGYLLTGQADYLSPYREALKDVPRTLSWLKEHYSTQQDRARSIERIDEEISVKFSEMASSIRMYDEGRHGAWRELLATDIGKRHMDSVRAFTTEIISDETRASSDARKGVYDALLVNRVGVATLMVISLLGMLLYLRQVEVSAEERRTQQQALQFERDRLEVEVARRTSELTMLSRYLITAREDERSRLARELHDELGALLTTAKLDTARIKNRIAALSPEAAERLVHLNETLNSGIALKRRIIEDLRPSALNNLGLVTALEILVREFESRSEVQVQCELTPLPLTKDCELTVYRLVQESLTNISKHARARSVRVTLGERNGMGEIAVTDDGIGFDPAVRDLAAHGLLGMRHRVEAEGGSLALSSTPGAGTRVAAVLPLARAA